MSTKDIDLLKLKIKILEKDVKNQDKIIKILNNNNDKLDKKQENSIKNTSVQKCKQPSELNNKFRILSPSYNNYNTILGFAIPSNTKILYKEKNKFCHIEVIDSYVFGKILLIDNDLQTTEKDEFVYHEMNSHIPLAYLPNAKDVLIIGGGDGGTAKQILKHKNIRRIDNVEICKEVVDVCKKYFPEMASSFKSKKVKLHIQDGAEYVKKLNRKYDLIIVDSTDLDYKNKIFKSTFYKNLTKILKKNGILIVNYKEEFTDHFFNNELSRYYKKYINILKSNFKYIQMYHCTIPSYIGSLYTFLFCSNTINPKTDEIDWETFLSKNIETKYYNKHIHELSFYSPNFVKSI